MPGDLPRLEEGACGVGKGRQLAIEAWLKEWRQATYNGLRRDLRRVETVEVDSVEPGSSGGFVADAAWTVGGTVTHFGHRHFRQNRYDARVDVVPVEGHWKIRSIEVLDEKRLQ